MTTPKTPGENLLENLEKLRQTLNTLSSRLNNSGVERTSGLMNSMGNNCDFYKKSLDIFLNKDYIDLRNLVELSHQLFQLVEGKNK